MHCSPYTINCPSLRCWIRTTKQAKRYPRRDRSLKVDTIMFLYSARPIFLPCSEDTCSSVAESFDVCCAGKCFVRRSGEVNRLTGTSFHLLQCRQIIFCCILDRWVALLLPALASHCLRAVVTGVCHGAANRRSNCRRRSTRQ